MNWFTDTEKKVADKVSSLWNNQDAALLLFVSPLLQQLKAAALQLGKNNLEAGIKILQDAAVAAAIAAATAPPGAKVSVAEATFLKILAAEGLDAIHNAEAAAIKAGVAILQTKTPVSVSSALLATLPSVNVTAANT